MGLPWFRMETSFPRNPKVLILTGERDGWQAAFAWASSIAYSQEQGTGGFIPLAALPYIHANGKIAKILCDDARPLWHQVPGGYQVHDYEDFQLATGDVDERRRRQQLGAVKGNCIRWHGKDCGCWRLALPNRSAESVSGLGQQTPTNVRTD